MEKQQYIWQGLYYRTMEHVSVEKHNTGYHISGQIIGETPNWCTRVACAFNAIISYLYHMSRKYKFRNPQGLYFVSFATVYWIGVFIRSVYCEVLVDSLKYCQENLGLQLYCWCIMPSHVHLIFGASDGNPAVLLGRFKEFTAKKVIKSIQENQKESRREWMLEMFEQAGSKSSNEIIDQKAEYLHQNPVEAGFVEEAHYWKFSSAIDYSGGKGLIAVEYL